MLDKNTRWLIYLFCFLWNRLLHSEDSMEASSYPQISGLIKSPDVLCGLDSHVARYNLHYQTRCLGLFSNHKYKILCYFLYRWTVVGNLELPETPMFLCTDCTHSFCFLNNQKTGNFKVYPFFQLTTAWWYPLILVCYECTKNFDLIIIYVVSDFFLNFLNFCISAQFINAIILHKIHRQIGADINSVF